MEEITLEEQPQCQIQMKVFYLTAFQMNFFCIMLLLIKGNIIYSDIEILEKLIEEKSIENDLYSSNFTKIYLHGPSAGSNISSRYRCNDEKKKKRKKGS